MPNIKRETAKNCNVKDLLKGRYIKREGWEPSYVETSFGKISRANILGVNVSEQEKGFIMDDQTGLIPIRSFETLKQDFEIGELYLVIGRPRSFNDEIFIVPEIIKKIENKKWFELRKIELQKRTKEIETKEKTETEIKEPQEFTTNDKILKKISELDSGAGVKINELTAFFELEQINKIVNLLIEQGEIFEIKPGVVKIL